MRARPVAPEGHESHATTRLAWVVSFIATVALFALLSVAHAAQAQAPPGSSASPPFPLAFEEEDEEEWGETEWEEAEEAWCEEDEEGGEEWCEEEEEAEDEPSQCVLTEATGRVVARPRRNRLDLIVRYRAEHPAAVTIRWSLRGRRGRLGLGTERARFGRAGTYRHRETHLNRKRMKKALASREFRVTVRAVNTPSYCKSEFDLRLSSRHGPRARPYWTERRN